MFHEWQNSVCAWTRGLHTSRVHGRSEDSSDEATLKTAVPGALSTPRGSSLANVTMNKYALDTYAERRLEGRSLIFMQCGPYAVLRWRSGHSFKSVDFEADIEDS